MFTTKAKLMDAKTLSGGAAPVTYYSDSFDIQNYHGCSIHIAVSGAGTLTTAANGVYVQASNDNSNWVNVNGATATLAGLSPIAFNLPDMYHGLLRVVIVTNSAAGTSSVLTINGIAKEY